MVDAPKTVNSYPVVLAHATTGGEGTRAGWIILVDRSTDETVAINPPAGVQRYVTSWIGVGDNQWHHGNYFTDRLDAIEDWLKRARRNY